MSNYIHFVWEPHEKILVLFFTMTTKIFKIVWNVDILMWATLIAHISVGNLRFQNFLKETCKAWYIWYTLQVMLARLASWMSSCHWVSNGCGSLSLCALGMLLLTHWLRYYDVNLFVFHVSHFYCVDMHNETCVRISNLCWGINKTWIEDWITLI